MAVRPISAHDALIVVDVQQDFCPGGALAIRGGDEVVGVLNDWMDAFRDSGGRIFLSRDWHPPDHASFHEKGGPWPRHCVQGSEGARFHARLRIPDGALVVSKGTAREREGYSAFDETDLATRLKDQGVRRVWIGGLALDVCVRATALDACRAGFETHLLAAATRSVDDDRGRKATEEMRAAGAIIELDSHP
jgi:nicotinamidase/pyrazinamidase